MHYNTVGVVTCQQVCNVTVFGLSHMRKVLISTRGMLFQLKIMLINKQKSLVGQTFLHESAQLEKNLKKSSYSPLL